MNRAEFFEAANQLWSWVDALRRKTRWNLRQFEDQLCRKPKPVPGAPSPEVVVLMCLKEIGDRIEEAMYAYDQLCRAAGVCPWFELAFRVIDSPRPVRLQIRELLDRGSFPGAPDIPESVEGALGQ
jgi:hypothetical protein